MPETVRADLGKEGQRLYDIYEFLNRYKAGYVPISAQAFGGDFSQIQDNGKFDIPIPTGRAVGRITEAVYYSIEDDAIVVIPLEKFVKAGRPARLRLKALELEVEE